MKLWYYRNFKILSEKKALELNLVWYCNIYGDLINALNCRSIYKDTKGNKYRIHELNYSNI